MTESATTRSTHRADLVAIAAIVSFIVLVFAPVWAGGRYFVSDGQFAHFFAPLSAWSDTWIGGWPAAADPATYASYPLRLLLAPLGAFNAFVISAYVIAAIGLYWYLRLLEVSPQGSALGALGFAFSGFMIGHLWNGSMVHAAAWITPALAGVEECIRSKQRRGAIVIVASVSLCLLTGHAQVATYGLLLMASYLIFKVPEAWRTHRMRWWILAAAAPLAGIAMVFPQIFATFAYLPETPRAQLTYETFVVPSLPVSQLPTFFFPFLFGGGTPPYVGDYVGRFFFPATCFHMPFLLFVLAIAGTCVRDRRAYAIFWATVTMLGLVLALGNGIPTVAHLAYKIPGLNLFRAPGRHVMEACLATSILAAFGFDALTKVDVRKALWFGSLSIALTLLVCALAAAVHNYDLLLQMAHTRRIEMPGWKQNFGLWVPLGLSLSALGACAVGISARPFSTKSPVILLTVILQAWAFAGFAPWAQTSPNADSYQPLPIEEEVASRLATSGGRVLSLIGTPGRLLTPERSRFWQLPSTNWYGPLIPARTAEALHIDSSGAAGASLLAADDVALDLYGIRYLVVNSAIDPLEHAPQRFELVGEFENERVWKNERAFPLAWLVGKWTQLDEDHVAFEIIHGQPLPGGRTLAPAREAIVSDLASAEVPDFDTGSIVDSRWIQDDEIEANVRSKTGGLLVSGVSFVSGWQGSIDGEEVSVHRANGSLLALAVPEGSHVVRLRYHGVPMPISMRVGLILVLSAFILLYLGARRRGTGHA